MNQKFTNDPSGADASHRRPRCRPECNPEVLAIQAEAERVAMEGWAEQEQGWEMAISSGGGVCPQPGPGLWKLLSAMQRVGALAVALETVYPEGTWGSLVRAIHKWSTERIEEIEAALLWGAPGAPPPDNPLPQSPTLDDLLKAMQDVQDIAQALELDYPRGTEIGELVRGIGQDAKTFIEDIRRAMAGKNAAEESTTPPASPPSGRPSGGVRPRPNPSGEIV